MSRYILIVEEEEDLLEVLLITANSYYDGRVVSARGGGEALDRLKANGEPELIVLDSGLSSKGADSIFTYLRENYPNCPTLLCTALSLEEAKEKYPGASKVLQKPNLFEPFLAALAGARQKNLDAEGYVPIRLSLLLKIRFIRFDLFLKLSGDRFVKIFHRDTIFLPEDAAKILKKRFAHLYLRKADAKRFLAELETLASLTCSEETAGVAEPSLQLSAGFVEAVHGISNALGWSEEVVLAAKASAELAIRAVSKVPSLWDLLSQRLSDPSSRFSEHICQITFVSCGLAQRLEWASDFTQGKLAMAAMLHDLNVEEEKYFDIVSWNQRALKSEDSMEGMVYRQHPIHAASEVARIPGLPPDLDQIILQHHEKPDGSGFPNGISAARISPLSAIFIVSEDLCATLRGQDDPKLFLRRFLDEKEELYSVGSFRKVYEVLANDLSLSTTR